jgi:hypothetical protein
MPKLSKTEAKIVARLAVVDRYSASKGVGRGPKGGHIDSGHREFDACVALIRKGLARELARTSYRVTARGHTEYVSDITIELMGG